MSMKVECDLCKDEIGEDMATYEIKKGTAAAGVVEGFAAHVCDKCAKALGVNAFIHKFKSMGAIDLVARAREAAMEEQRAQAARPQLVGPDAPAPVDPRVMAKIQGR